MPRRKKVEPEATPVTAEIVSNNELTIFDASFYDSDPVLQALEDVNLDELLATTGADFDPEIDPLFDETDLNDFDDLFTL